jgi:hypothetical protein
MKKLEGANFPGISPEEVDKAEKIKLEKAQEDSNEKATEK